VYRIAKDGKLTAVITDLVNPNGWPSRPTRRSSTSWSGRAGYTIALLVGTIAVAAVPRISIGFM
jgi:hypothetical protein